MKKNITAILTSTMKLTLRKLWGTERRVENLANWVENTMDKGAVDMGERECGSQEISIHFWTSLSWNALLQSALLPKPNPLSTHWNVGQKHRNWHVPHAPMTMSAHNFGGEVAWWSWILLNATLPMCTWLFKREERGGSFWPIRLASNAHER